MDATTISALALACAPLVHVGTTRALVSVESSFNPYAIGVVGGVLEHQPRSRGEARRTAEALTSAGWNYSIGLAQINVRNLRRLGLTNDTAFDACQNLRAMQSILTECFDRVGKGFNSQTAVRRALSCYYSGNAITGFQHGYVQRVANAAPRFHIPAAPRRNAIVSTG